MEPPYPYPSWGYQMAYGYGYNKDGLQRPSNGRQNTANLVVLIIVLDY